MEDCIFCKIAGGQIPLPLIYEDEWVVAFNDAQPQAPVHVLIVPRTHHADVGDEVSAGLASALVAAIPKVAGIAGVAASGYRTIINSGADARQSVPHLHVHVLGGALMTHGMVGFA